MLDENRNRCGKHNLKAIVKQKQGFPLTMMSNSISLEYSVKNYAFLNI